jgi:hypothetical protein
VSGIIELEEEHMRSPRSFVLFNPPNQIIVIFGTLFGSVTCVVTGLYVGWDYRCSRGVMLISSLVRKK